MKYLEKSIKKRNLVFLGLKEEVNRKADLKALVISTIKEYLNINVNDHDIEDAYRIGGKTNNTRPVLVSFSNLNVKNSIFTKRTSLKKTNIFINMDLYKEDYLKRKELAMKVKEHKAEDRNAKIIQNKIQIINEGKKKPQTKRHR